MKTAAERRAYLRGIRAARHELRRRVEKLPIKQRVQNLRELDALQAYDLGVEETVDVLRARLDAFLTIESVLHGPAAPSGGRFVAVDVQRDGFEMRVSGCEPPPGCDAQFDKAANFSRAVHDEIEPTPPAPHRWLTTL